MPRGFRFRCTGCGACCRAPGYVYFDLATLRRMARHLDLTLAAFRTRFEVQWDPEAASYVIDASHGNGCSLLQGDDCRVHPVKPEQCQAFPFWSELVADPESLRRARDLCEGFGQADGTWFSWAEVKRRARAT